MLNAAKDFVFAVKALEEDATPEQCAAVLKGPLVGAGGADARIDFSTFVACVDGFSAAGAITSFNASDSGGKGFLDISDLAHMDMSDAEVSTTMDEVGTGGRVSLNQYWASNRKKYWS